MSLDASRLMHHWMHPGPHIVLFLLALEQMELWQDRLGSDNTLLHCAMHRSESGWSLDTSQSTDGRTDQCFDSVWRPLASTLPLFLAGEAAILTIKRKAQLAFPLLVSDIDVQNYPKLLRGCCAGHSKSRDRYDAEHCWLKAVRCVS